MKMKKLIAAILCALLTCFALASCAEEDIKDHANDELDRYHGFYKPEVVVKLHYNLYIITENGNSEAEINAETTVQAKINQILGDNYNTMVTIHYLSADEYAAKVDDAVANIGNSAGTTNSVTNGGSIVLITGKDMYDSLMSKNALVDMRGFLDTNAYGKLNTQITPTLLDSAKVDVDGVEKMFFLPNDHIIGEYSYTVIDRSIAEGVLNFSAQSELYEMLITDGENNEMAQELVDAYEANKANLADITLDDVIKEVKGSYADKALWESKGYVCNISKYPTVTPDETYVAGFGILTPPTYEEDLDDNAETSNADFLAMRAMDVIYAINADFEVRNLLQYGVEYANYKLVESDEVDSNGDKVKYVEFIDDNYKMNLLFTGDMFNSYNCSSNVWKIGDENGNWSYVFATNGDKQNSDSVFDK